MRKFLFIIKGKNMFLFSDNKKIVTNEDLKKIDEIFEINDGNIFNNYIIDEIIKKSKINEHMRINVYFDDVDYMTFMISKILGIGLNILVRNDNDIKYITTKYSKKGIAHSEIKKSLLNIEFTTIDDSYDSILYFGCGNVIDIEDDYHYPKNSKDKYMHLLVDPTIMSTEMIVPRQFRFDIDIFDYDGAYETRLLFGGNIKKFQAYRSLEHLTLTQLKELPHLLKKYYLFDPEVEFDVLVPDYDILVREYLSNKKYCRDLFTDDMHKINCEIFGYDDWEKDSDHKYAWTRIKMIEYAKYFMKIIHNYNDIEILYDDYESVDSPPWYHHLKCKGI